MPPPSPPPTHRRSAVLRTALAAPPAFALVLAPAVHAQGTTPASSTVRGGDVAVVGTAAFAATALTPFDARIARWSQRPALQERAALRRPAAVFRWLGQPGALGLGVATYGVGLAARDRDAATVGLRMTGSVLAASVVTTSIKLLVGRARPATVGDTLPYSYALGRGLRRGNDYQSMPSGHATAAFAAAAALTSEGARRWADVNRVTGPAAYAAAALVGASRVYHDRHWASDVVAGAGVGTFAGVVLTRYLRTHPDNTIERRLLPSAAGNAPARRVARRRAPFAVAYSVRF